MFSPACLTVFVLNVLLVKSAKIPEDVEQPSKLMKNDFLDARITPDIKCPVGSYREKENCQACSRAKNCVGVVTCTTSTNQRCSACADGYRGATCEVYSNCASYPCQNGATCQDITDGYLCTCLPGYTGVNCDAAVNECASSPCLNGGTCVDYANAYVCVCSPGVTGTRCETYANECASNPCQNNGTCLDYDNGYTCSCLPANNGENCQYDTCQFYVIERSTYNGGGGGFISKVDDKGNVIRLSSTGDTNENGMVRDGSLLFYTTGGNDHVWRASTDNPAATRTIIWQTSSNSAQAIGISRTDKRLFIDDPAWNRIDMITYDGGVVSYVDVGQSTGAHIGFATDEANRILYFTDYDLDSISSVRFLASGFNGTVNVLLSGTAVVGDFPTGIVFIAQENKLYWILRDTQEIRSLAIATSTVQLVAAADTLGGSTFGLTACGGTLFYTHSTGGIWRISTDYGRVKVTKDNTLQTRPITSA